MDRKLGLALLLATVWAVAAGAAEAPQAMPQATYQAMPQAAIGNPNVDYDGGKDVLSVDARAIPLGQLLRLIGKKVGIEVKMIQDAEKPVTLKFSGMSAEMGIRFIGEETSMNYGLFFSQHPGAEGVWQRKVSALWVMAPGKGGGSPAPVPSAALASVSDQRQPNVTPVASPGATSNPALPNPAEIDETAKKNAARERLERRLANLPPAERERVIKADEERTKRREERMQSLSKAREERRKTIMNEEQQGGQ